MDLGIRGRKAIVCASSAGLGKGCAVALAEAGVSLVINGRDRAALEATAQEIRSGFSVDVIAIAGDIGTPEGQAAVLAACPDPRGRSRHHLRRGAARACHSAQVPSGCCGLLRRPSRV